MKTRQEMIYDFMLALTPSYLEIAKQCDELNQLSLGDIDAAEDLHFMACVLADEYLKNLG